MDQVPPLLNVAPPPLLPAEPASNKKSPGRGLCKLLSFCLALFVVDGFLSFVDDGGILLLGFHGLSIPRGLISLATILMAAFLYVMIGVTPRVPKRLFLPIPLFFLISLLAMFSFAIFWYHRAAQIGFLVSTCEFLLGLALLSMAWTGAGGDKSSPWPLVKPEQLGAGNFSWKRPLLFLLANVFVLLPLVAGYLFFCTSRAVGHYSAGFVALRPSGFVVQARKYVRDDGKTIELFPMAHIADKDFYREVSQAFPTNSMILMEGVSDSENLLTNKITYQRMASALGLTEQKATFKPGRGEAIRADVDVGQFSKNTINFLNLVMLFHAKGLTPENISTLANFTPPPGFEEQLFDDLLVKRNEHLLGEIESHLAETDYIMVPWGAAHMPGLERGVMEKGFRLSERKDFVVVRFGRKNVK